MPDVTETSNYSGGEEVKNDVSPILVLRLATAAGGGEGGGDGGRGKEESREKDTSPRHQSQLQPEKIPSPPPAVVEAETEPQQPRNRPRTRRNSRLEAELVASNLPTDVGGTKGDADDTEASAPPPLGNDRVRRVRGGRKDSVGSEVQLGGTKEEVAASPPPSRVKAKPVGVRRNSKIDNDIDSDSVLKETFESVNESVSACPPSSPTPSSTSATGARVCRQTPVVLKQESEEPSSGRGGRGRGAARGTGRRGQQYRKRGGNKDQVRRGLTYDDLDFHSPWFASMYDPNTIPHLFGGDLGGVEEEELPNMPANYLSRELMLQLTNNINNGLACVGQAFDLIRMSAHELYGAKLTLQRIYRNQQRNLETESPAATDENLYGHSPPPPGEGFQPVSVESVKEEVVSADADQTYSNIPQVFQSTDRQPESFQVNIDPVECLPVDDDAPGRLGKGNRRKLEEEDRVEDYSTSTKRQKRRSPRNGDFSSGYNSNLAMSGVNTLLKHLMVTDVPVPKDSPNHRSVTVTLTDIRQTLSRANPLRPNVFSARKILSAIKRRSSRNSSSSVDKAAGRGRGKVKANLIKRPLLNQRTLPVPTEVMDRLKERVHSESDSSDCFSSADVSPNDPSGTSLFIKKKKTDPNNNPNSKKDLSVLPQNCTSTNVDSEVSCATPHTSQKMLQDDADNSDCLGPNANELLNNVDNDTAAFSNNGNRIVYVHDYTIAECGEKIDEVTEDNHQRPPDIQQSNPAPEEQNSRAKQVSLPKFERSSRVNFENKDAKLDAINSSDLNDILINDSDLGLKISASETELLMKDALTIVSEDIEIDGFESESS